MFKRVQDEPESALPFIAHALPVASGIVQSRSPVVDLRRMEKREKAANPEINVGDKLTSLALVDLLSRGHKAAMDSGDPSSQQLWETMWQRVRHQFECV
jgi:hypothetical protein